MVDEERGRSGEKAFENPICTAAIRASKAARRRGRRGAGLLIASLLLVAAGWGAVGYSSWGSGASPMVLAGSALSFALGFALLSIRLRRAGRAEAALGEEAESLRTAVVEVSAERTAAEERLRAQAALMDSLGDAVVTTDLEFRIRSWNRAAERLYGYTEGETLGRRIGEIIRTEFVETNREEALNELRARGEWEGETIHHGKEGTRVRIFASVKVISDSSGNPAGFIAVHRDETERHFALKELARSEATFRGAFDASGLGMALIDLDGRFLSVNRAVTKILGYPEEELLTLSFTDITHPDDVAPSLSDWMGLLEGRVPMLQRTKRYLRQDGTTMEGIVTVSLVRDADGSPVHAVAQLQDVSALREEEHARREIEGRLDRLAKAAQEIIFCYRCRPTPGFEYVNPAAERITGYSVREHMDDPALGDKLFHPDDLPWLREIYAGEVAQGTVTARWIRKDGREIEVEMSIIPVRDKSGQLEAIEGIVRDVTDRRRAEESIRRSERRFRSLYEGMRDGFARCDAEGRIVESNDEFRRIVGYGEEELAGLRHRELTPAKWRIFEKTVVAEQLAERGYSDIYEKEYRRPNGSLVSVEIRVHRTMDDEGRESGTWAIVRDITERRRAEEELRSSRRALVRAQQIAGLGTCKYDVVSGEVTWSGEMFRIMGLARQEPSYELARSVVHPDDLDHWAGSVRSAIDDGAGFRIDYRIVRPDGAVRWIHNEAEIARDASGKAIRFFGTAQDVTETRETMRALRESEDRYRSLFDTVSDAILVCDAEDTNVVDANASACRLYGYTYDEIRQLRMADLSGDLATTKERLRQAAGGRDLVGVTGRHRKKDGTIFPVEVSSGRFTHDGRTFLVGVARDISPRVAAEEALRAERDRAHDYLEIAGSMMVALDENGRIRMINERACEVLGCSKEEGLGLDWFETFVPEEVREDVREYFHRLLAGEIEGIERYENEVVTLSGDRRTIEWTNRVVRDAEGSVVGTLGSGEDRTERLRADAALRQASERFRIAAECASDLIYEWHLGDDRLEWFGDIDGALGFAPGAFPRTLEAWLERIHPDDAPRLAEEVRNHRSSGGPLDTEYRIRHESGEWLVWTDRGTAIRDDEGRPVRLVGVCTDITDRRRAEIALYESEAKYRMVFDNVAEGIVVTQGGRIRLANPQVIDLVGLPIDEIVTKPFTDFVHPDDREMVLENNRARLAGELGPMSYPFRAIDGRGNVRWIEINGVLIDWEGETAVLSFLTDITARMEAEEERRKLMTLAESAAFGIAIADLDGNLTYVNDFFARVHGYEPDEVNGKNLRMFHTESQLPRVMEVNRKLIEEGSFLSEEVMHVTKDGRVLPMLMNGVVVKNERGEPMYIGATATDLTAAKEAERERERLEERLRRSAKMEAIGTLAGGIAHDFNNILYAILGFTDLALDDTPAEAKSHDCLEQVRDAGLRASELVHRILAFSRQEPTERKNVRLQETVSEALDLLRGTLPSSIEIRRFVDDDCPPVFADPTEIHQVLMNLGTNAFHAMQETGGELTVRLRARELTARRARGRALPPGRYVELTVRDTGCGMDEETRIRAFDPYFTTKALGEGTGMGLATVHGIVESLGGAVDVTSAPGRGSSFRVLLPARAGATDAREEESDDSPAGDERVLFIDDERPITRLARAFLESYGYRVEVHSNPVRALGRFRSDPHRFDVIVTDQMMKGLTGLELARRIREGGSEIPIVLCAGFMNEKLLEDAKGVGIGECLLKPLERADLAKAVRRAIRRQPALEG